MRNHLGALLLGAIVLLAACTDEAVLDQAAPVDEPVATTTQVEPTAIPAQTLPVAATAVPTPTVPATVVPQPTPTPLPAEPTPVATPTVQPIPRPTLAPVADVDHSGLAGARSLTLQWISWEPEDWGRVEFVPLTDGTYSVSGRQDGDNGDFVEVDGTIVRVSESELRFNGTVTTQISHIGDGQPCVRSGEMIFLATGDRRFWRLQDQINCDGIVTDYVDIYFG